MKIGTVQKPGKDGVEKSFGKLRLLVFDQQADVEQLHLLQRCIVECAGFELVLKQACGFIRAVIVGGDAFAHRLMHAAPVTRFKKPLCLYAVMANQPVMPVESFNHGFGDLSGQEVLVYRNVHGDCPEMSCR